MSADERKPWALTRRQILEGGAALAVLGYVRPGFAAEVNPVAPPVLPSDPGVSSWPGNITVNGVEQSLALGYAHDCARHAAGAPRVYRPQEGLRPRTVRGLHRAGWRP